jgi:hypothetical protein
MTHATTHDDLREHCHAAVEALCRVLDERPAEEHEYLLEAVRCLVRLRDRLIEQRRSGHPSPDLQDRLDRANAILSVVVGGQYPLVGVRWERVSHARDELRALLELDA